LAEDGFTRHTWSTHSHLTCTTCGCLVDHRYTKSHRETCPGADGMVRRKGEEGDADLPQSEGMACPQGERRTSLSMGDRITRAEITEDDVTVWFDTSDEAWSIREFTPGSPTRKHLDACHQAFLQARE